MVPAAAVDVQQKQWRAKRRRGKGGYLFNHKARAKAFRAKMLAGIMAAGLLLPERYPADWVVDCKSVGSGALALIYLGRYLYWGVIREQDIVVCGDGQVTFRYRNAKTGRMEQRTVAGADFLWLVLQHVLPKGFRRARNFGFRPSLAAMADSARPIWLTTKPIRPAARAIPKRYLLQSAILDTLRPGSSNKGFRSWQARSNLSS